MAVAVTRHALILTVAVTSILTGYVRYTTVCSVNEL